MLRFVGDVNLTDWDFNFGFGIGSRLSQGFNPLPVEVTGGGNLWIGNFEGVASDVTDRNGMAAKVFRVSPYALRHIRHLHVYGFANNHAMQHGVAAYQATVSALREQGCKVFGTDDKRSVSLEHQGRQVIITGCCLRVDEFTNKPSYWYNPEYSDIEKEIAKLPADAFKVFYVHWGNEYINRPSTQQQKFAHWLIDAGFDLVIGMHPHVLQGYEEYKGKRIYYSLGNFVFDMVWEPCRYGAVVSVDFTGGIPIFHEEYVYIDESCAPHFVEDSEVPEKYRFEFLNNLINKEDNSEEYHAEICRMYKAYSKANRKNVIKNILRHPQFGMSVLSDFVRRRFIH